MLSVTKFAMSKASMGGANFAPGLSARARWKYQERYVKYTFERKEKMKKDKMNISNLIIWLVLANYLHQL